MHSLYSRNMRRRYLYGSGASLPMQAFVAPAGFDPDAQELNIVKAYAAFSDVNKKYIFSVGTSTTTVLPAVTGRSYAYAENLGSYTTIASGTVTWTSGSTKRHVIGIDTASTVGSTIPSGVVWLYCGDKVVFVNSDSVTTLKYVHFSTRTSLSSIYDSSFYGCTGLIGMLTIPSSVTSIGNYAFRYCAGLTGLLVIPDSINSIGVNAFQNCTGFSGSLTLSSNMTSTGISAFYGCSGFTGTLTIPSSITTINEFSFYHCKFTGTLIIPSSVTSIGAGAFDTCNGFTGTLIIPSSVTGIGYSAFENCSGFTGSINIPNSITYIADSAFGSDRFTGTLTIPNTITAIYNYAFYNCSALVRIDCYLSYPISITSTVFSGVNKTTCILHVPAGSLAAYRAATYWTDFVNIIADL